MNYVRQARANGYLDGLEQRPNRSGPYNIRTEAEAYQAGYDDGVIAREKMREDLRSKARKDFGAMRLLIFCGTRSALEKYDAVAKENASAQG